MVMRANAAYVGLGGHVASYASAAEIFEVGFNHFFHAAGGNHGGDVVFFQPHSAPGVYASAFLEGRLTEAQLKRYRQEIGVPGLSSYPHPWLMPDFWQTPTGSMGVGPIGAVHKGKSLAKTAELCDVHPTTAFRWRHRFLRAPASDKPRMLRGIIEANETFVLESFKGR
jgi:pyruvate dehydrogenase complex dehydrogenase (E1) component